MKKNLEKGSKPLPLRGVSLWQFHTEESIVGAEIDRRTGGALALDAGGSLYLLDPTGRLVTRHRLAEEPRDVAWSRYGFWAVLLEGRLIKLDMRGEILAEIPTSPFHVRLAAGPRGVLATAPEKGSLVMYSEDGRSVAERQITHPVLDLAFCSLEGALVVAGPYGELTLLDPSAENRWRALLRVNTVGIAASLVGTFVVGNYDRGAYAFNEHGESLGLYDPKEPLAACALSPESGHLILADVHGVLYYISFKSGYCLWRDGRTPGPTLVRVSRMGRRVLSASAAGSVECLNFIPEEGRGVYLELLEPKRSGDGGTIWKNADVVFEDHGGEGLFALAPSGTSFAVAMENDITIYGRRGQKVRTVSCPVGPAELQFNGDGRIIFARSQEGLLIVPVEEGDVSVLWGYYEDIVPGEGERFAALTGDKPFTPLRMGVFRRGGPEWEWALPATAVAMTAAPDLSLLGVACDNGRFYCLNGEGHMLWHRHHGSGGAKALVGDTEVYFADGDGTVMCYGLDGSLSWKVRADKPLVLFRLGGDIFGRDEDNRFWRFDPRGDVEALDQGENLGRSYLVRDSMGSLVELNIHGGTLACLDLAGRILWKFQAGENVATTRFHAAGGLIAFRAGRKAYLMSVDTVSDRPGLDRGSFLEV